jgi:hypothetical protein
MLAAKGGFGPARFRASRLRGRAATKALNGRAICDLDERGVQEAVVATSKLR